MRIALGVDHAGFLLKKEVIKFLKEKGVEVLDLGTNSEESVDYPDYAKAVGEAVQQGKADRGILVCGSGIGACVAANKVLGIRAGTCHDTYSAHQGVEHDNMNVLCIGARIIGSELAHEIINAFISANFSNAERHKRRLNKIAIIERSQLGKLDEKNLKNSA